MRYQTKRVFPLAAAGLMWMTLAAVPGAAQMVEKQSTSSSGSSASSSSKSSAPSRSASSSRSSSRSSSSARSSGSSQRSRARSQDSRSSSSRTRAVPRSSGETRGGRGFGTYRETKEVDTIDRRHRRRDHDRRDRVRDRRDRRHRSGHHGYNYHYRNRYRYGGHYGYYSYPYVSYYGAFGFWCPTWFDARWGYGSWGRYRRPVTVYVDDYDNGHVGALDLDVSPEKAEIYIDGRLVGVADNFDGFPTFLWLADGTYDVAIYKPGYETIFRQYTIYPGAVIDVEDRMQPGESIHPDDYYVQKSTVNRDERIRRNREREAAVEAQKAPVLEAPEAPPMDRGSSGEIGRLALDILPPDAAVYLDGIFLGTAEEVTGLTAGLVVEGGEHVLEITRPGFEPRKIDISLSPGERVDLAIVLDRQ